MRGVMPRARRARRNGEESYPLSPWSLAGRSRGRPGFARGPMMGGIASTRGSSWVESWALAAQSRTAKGMPFRSTTRWYVEPTLPRSVGFGPVCSPPFRPDAEAVHARPRPVGGRLVAQPVQEPFVQLLPDASLLPVTESALAGGAAAAAQFFGQPPPGTARPQGEDDAAEGGTVGDAGPATLGLGRLLRQQGFDGFPELGGNKEFTHSGGQYGTPLGF